MGTKIYRKKDEENYYIYDQHGGYLGKLHGENDKNFAVIVKCGLCGNGYYIPVIFSCYCKDMETAIQLIKAMPRVKKDQRDFILDCFEVSKAESYLVKAINDHDPYLCGGENDEYDEVRKQARRCMHDSKVKQILKDNEGVSDKDLSNIIKTADMFEEEYVLQRYFGPMVRNGKLYHLNKYSRTQLLQDYFTQAVFRLGIRKGDVYFLSMLYQIYGKNNPLGLVYDNGKFLYTDKYGTVFTYEIDEVYINKLMESGVFERDKEVEREDFQTGKSNRISAIDKFKRRMESHNDLKNKSNNGSDSEPEGSQMS